jgi:aspartyl-tRNA(Asn)/glutamyl-tRNA(Gln) amidotransferase subunit A
LRTSAVEYVKILDRIAQHREEAANLFASYDLIATPTTAGLLWPKTEPYLKEIAGRPASPRASAIYTTWGNLAGLAGISVPSGGSAKNHPIGLQLLGAIGSEELLLDVAASIESHRPWPRLAPI